MNLNQHGGESLVECDLRISVIPGLSVPRDFRDLLPCCLWEKAGDK